MHFRIKFVFRRVQIPSSPSQSDPAEVDEILNNNLDFTRILQSDSVTIPRQSNEQFLNEMKHEMENSLNMDEEGYLPIHRAVEENDELIISRQCIILMARCKTIEFITDENSETPLHLAIKNEATLEIIQLLLNYNSNILSKNDDGNNALHLCILHSTNVEVLKLLLSKITMDKLGIYNYDGMSILHLAVLESKFLFAKTIIDYIDNALNIPQFTACDSEQLLYSKLQDYICSFTSDDKPKIDFNVRKMEILNQKNMKSGRTPLFLAVSLINENISFLLMAHGSDPRIEDFSGTDCNELSNHVIGNKLISTAVYNATYYLDSAEAEQTRKRYEASKLKLMRKDDVAPTKSSSKTNSGETTRGTKRTYSSVVTNKKVPPKMRIIEKS
jgi:ankyrin repeat protein